MSATTNGVPTSALCGTGRRKETGFDKLLHNVPIEALGMLIMHHRDEIFRLQKTRRARGLTIETPVGNDAQIEWHQGLLGELRLEAQLRDMESAV